MQTTRNLKPFYKEETGQKSVASRKEDLFGSTLQQTYSWIREIMSELHTNDRHRAYLALRAVLQSLRDRLGLDDSVHLGAQLPMLVRGLYYEGWKPDGKPVKYNRAQFLGVVGSYFAVPEKVNTEEIVRAVFSVLQRNLSVGEVRKLQHALPKSFAKLWTEQTVQ